MWQEERRLKIRSHLAKFGSVSVDQLTQELGVSRESIRRDLVAMEIEGLLQRVHGGAVRTQNEEDPSYLVRATVRMKEKQAIAFKAAGLVKAGQTVFVDAGTTTAALAERLSLIQDLTVITNSVQVASSIVAEQRATGSRALLLGGFLSLQPPETYGSATINEISKYKADFAFLSPFGVGIEGGVMNYSLEAAEVAAAMVKNSAKTVLMADYSKIGVSSRVKFCDLGQVFCLIVDPGCRDVIRMSGLEGRLPNIIYTDDI